MGKFRRFLGILYVLVSVAAIALLIAPWVGPFKDDAQAYVQIVLTHADVSRHTLLLSQAYCYGTLAAAAVCLLGLLVTLVKTVTAPSKRKTVRIGRVEGGEITVATAAIVSQAGRIVEADGACEVAKARVVTQGASHAQLNLSLRPLTDDGVSTLGNRLHALVENGLNDFTGGAVDKVSLHFLPARVEAAASRDLPVPVPLASAGQPEPHLGASLSHAGEGQLGAPAPEARGEAPDAPAEGLPEAPEPELEPGGEPDTHHEPSLGDGLAPQEGSDE